MVLNRPYLIMRTVLIVLSLFTISCAKKKLPAPEPAAMSAGELPTYTRLGPVKATSKADADAKALTIYKRIVGVSVPVTSPVIQQMSQLLLSGDVVGAAKLATDQEDFLNITVKFMAIKMTYRDEKPSNPSNDFVATFVGGIRDNINAKQLLTGNFYYRVDAAQLPAAGIAANDRTNMTIAGNADVLTKILKTNNHYQSLDNAGFRASYLTRVQPMVVRGVPAGAAANNAASEVVVNLPTQDASALLASRGFLAAHAIAGTNRRLLEYTFRAFNCVAMTDWSDTTRPDEFIGRDVDRYDQKFQTNCKGCHGQMDAMRGAFAYFDFFDGGAGNQFVKHSDPTVGYLRAPLNTNQADQVNQFKVFRAANGTALYGGVAQKLNRNEQTFTQGRITTDNRWINIAVGGKNPEYFGWKGSMEGQGLNSFATMISNSERFPKCMAERVFVEVCKRLPVDSDIPMLDWAAKEFAETHQYNFKNLFQLVATQAECIGQ